MTELDKALTELATQVAIDPINAKDIKKIKSALRGLIKSDRKKPSMEAAAAKKFQSVLPYIKLTKFKDAYDSVKTKYTVLGKDLKPFDESVLPKFTSFIDPLRESNEKALDSAEKDLKDPKIDRHEAELAVFKTRTTLLAPKKLLELQSANIEMFTNYIAARKGKLPNDELEVERKADLWVIAKAEQAIKKRFPHYSADITDKFFEEMKQKAAVIAVAESSLAEVEIEQILDNNAGDSKTVEAALDEAKSIEVIETIINLLPEKDKEYVTQDAVNERIDIIVQNLQPYVKELQAVRAEREKELPDPEKTMREVDIYLFKQAKVWLGKFQEANPNNNFTKEQLQQYYRETCPVFPLDVKEFKPDDILEFNYTVNGKKQSIKYTAADYSALRDKLQGFNNDFFQREWLEEYHKKIGRMDSQDDWKKPFESAYSFQVAKEKAKEIAAKEERPVYFEAEQGPFGGIAGNDFSWVDSSDQSEPNHNVAAQSSEVKDPKVSQKVQSTSPEEEFPGFDDPALDADDLSRGGSLNSSRSSSQRSSGSAQKAEKSQAVSPYNTEDKNPNVLKEAKNIGWNVQAFLAGRVLNGRTQVTEPSRGAGKPSIKGKNFSGP